MKLDMSIPERPGWIFVLPGFDFLCLLLALVMLTGVVVRESYIEVKLPPSEFRGVRLGDENPVVIILKSTAAGPVYYVGGQKVTPENLSSSIESEAKNRSTDLVAIRLEESVTTAQRQDLIDVIARLKFRIYEGMRSRDVE